MAVRIPLVVIGGFLGAGKTTFLNRLLQQPGCGRVAALVNDFGPINVDAELVASHDGKTISLSNGCICCSIGSGLEDGLIQALQQDPPMQLIVIEASGVSDPGRIAQVGLSDPMLQLLAVIVLVDSDQVVAQLDDPLLGDTLARQIQAATLLVLNKTDLVSRDDLRKMRARLTRQFGTMAIIETRDARVPVEALGLGSGLAASERQLTDQPNPARVAHGFDAHAADVHVGPGGERHLEDPLEHPFESGSWHCAGTLDADQLVATLKQLPRSVVRAKGWVTTDRHGPATIHVVGGRVRIEPMSDTRSGWPNELVYVGMRDADLRSSVESALQPLRTT